MCSSTLSVNCEYVEKWARAVRPYGRVTRLPFSYFSKQSPVSGMRQVKKQKEVGVHKRVETIDVYPLAPRRGSARPPGRQVPFASASDHSPKCEHFVKPVDIAE